MTKTIVFKFLILILFCTGFFAGLRPCHAAEREIFVPVDHAPPFHVFPADGKGGPYGETISVLKAVVDRVNRDANLGLTLKFSPNLPFKRCLAMMRKGDAQMAGSLLDKDDRREYMHLLMYKPNSNKIFLVRKDWPDEIKTIEDLKHKRVGTLRGYQYFREFDQDATILKDPANTLMMSLNKLLQKRFDIVICSEVEWEALQKQNPALSAKLKPATFRYDKPNPVYIGVAKNSWLARPPYFDALKRAVETMYAEGVFLDVITRFYESYKE